jgi:site-specific DNA recombinase
MVEISNPMDYKVALYIRLSKEDDSNSESQSVTNQRNFLLQYTKENNLDVFDIYVDDGFSGTSFNRPSFNRMLSDIEKNKVNMVVTKDMSRLGRNYIETGQFMEVYCPEREVRYIAVLDGVDTGKNSAANDISPFRAVMNDMYAKETSNKIKTTKRNKQQQGLFIGGKAPFGYVLSKTVKNTFDIDEEAANVVRRIFSIALSGMSCRQIAVGFNEEKVPTPAQYAKINVGRQGPYSGKWSSERIAEMIKNQTYIGCMVQGKRKKVSYKSSKCLKMDRCDWIVIPDKHPAIIDKEMFDKVQLMMETRTKVRTGVYDYVLKGIIHCHECGYPLGVINRPNSKGHETLYFVCRTYQRFTQDSACTCHCILVNKVTQAVMEKIKDICKSYMNMTALRSVAEKAVLEQKRLQNLDSDIFTLNKKLDSLTTNLDKMYMDKLSGILSDDDFTRIYTNAKCERSELEVKIKKLKTLKNDGGKQQEIVEGMVRRFTESPEYSKELIVSLIERIELSEDKQVYIYFRFKELDVING